MSDNLSIIIDYINDNFRFGGTVKNERVLGLLKKYPIEQNEENKVYDELRSLEIDITYPKGVSEEEICKSNIFEGNNEDGKEMSGTKKNDNGYIEPQIDLDKLDFLDQFDFEDLDAILEDGKFLEEIKQLDDVVHSRYNSEYLVDYHSKEADSEKRKQALSNLVKANQKLVWKTVLRYKHFSTVSFDEADMYQAGMQGLLKAVEKFDISLGYQFSTYATHWIMQSITRNIADFSTTIRVPVHMRERIQKYLKFQNDFWNKNGKIASNVEAADALKVSKEEIEKLKMYKEVANLTSLDVPIGEDESSVLGEFIVDTQRKTPEKYAEEKALKREITKLFETKLTPREVKILDSRFGLTDNEEHTLEEVGQAENVTRERVRQIEAKAIKKLSSPRNKERLKDFYYD